MRTTVQEDKPGTILSIEGIGKHVIKIETLLVPIDFSPASMQMFNYAAAFAKRFNANVHLVHVYPPDEAALVPGAGDLIRQTAEELFSDQLLPAHRAQLSSFRPQNCHVRSGIAYQEICDLAWEIQADLIVLATRGHTGLKHVLLGSTAERVARMAPCPVLVVRQKKQKSRAISRLTKAIPVEFNVRKILVPVDFSQCSLAGAMHAALIAKTLDATVCFIHVAYPPGPVLVDRVSGEISRRNELQRADARLNMEALMKLDFLRGIKCESEIRTGYPIDEICSETSRPDIDLVISSTHGRTGLDHMLLGSVAEHVVRYAECPVMIVPSRFPPFLKSMPKSIVDLVSEKAEALVGAPNDFDSLIDMIGDARFVLIGEASHGTHEFYRIRAQISKILIAQRGFSAVAVEADWPDAYRVNRFVRGASKDSDSVEALAGFQRFPQWMWRNADVLDFVGWLREHNDQQAFEDRKCGFYGLDLYSLHASIEAVLAYLSKVDPEAAKRARHHYSCFEHFGKDITTYGYAAGFQMTPSCEQAVVKSLVELRHKAMEYLQRDGQVAADAYFCAEQNALVVRNAEEYYRNMFRREVSSWNLRDTHMMESLVRLAIHLSNQRPPAKIIVWAHNSHLGDARATQMGERGELNLGQLVREHFGKEAVSIGFTTYDGTVTAASDWDGPAERKNVRPAHPESYEALFHDVDVPNFFLNLRDDGDVASYLRSERLERAIGVIYRPETELLSHYFHARLPDQFDATLHYDHTRAVEPLERTAEWQAGEVEETFPSGL